MGVTCGQPVPVVLILSSMSNPAPLPLAEVAPPEPEWTLGERIRKLRSLMHLDQEQFGKRFDKHVSDSLISKWENGSREPKLSQLHEMESWGVVPKGFLVRSRCTSLGELRLIPGGRSSHAVIVQMALPFLTPVADN